MACPTCSSEYNIDERRVPPGGLNVRCPKCQGAFPVRPPLGGGAAVPLPGGTRPAKVALPTPTVPPAPAGATLRFQAPAAAPATGTFDPPFATEGDPESPFVRPPAPAGAIATAAAGSGSAEPFGAGQTLVGYAPPGPLSFGEVELGEQDDGRDDPLPCAPEAPKPELPLPADPFAADSIPEPDDPFVSPLSPEGGSEQPFAEAEPVADDPVGAAPPAPTPRAPPRADAGAPVTNAPAGEDLEMLFDEGAAARAAPAPATGYKVRRRSGKIFGPFEEAAVVEMLCKGELLGNEDVTIDGGASFVAIGTIGPFADAMRRLMGGPPPAAAPEKTGTLPRIALLSREAPGRMLDGGRRVLALRHSRLALAVAAG
ncbi:MAG TPA: zinc-ribbon domain-containing protein, partial [Anaeromyxobacteraceae bacterium]